MALLLLVNGDTVRAAGASDAERPPESVEALMDAFASGGGVRARFEETRRLAILAEPIESSGVLYFAPPDKLARVTTEPGDSRVVVHGDRVGLSDETGYRELDLGRSAVARSMVANLMVLLRGDLSGLRDQYTVSYAVGGDTWELVLEPRDESLGAIVDRVRASGVGRNLTGIETVETNGDSTSSKLFDVVVGVDFSTPAQARVFSFGPADPTP